ncbi:uncharacterized protein N7511_008443 [Penicillium nucicola]|uniref:uncharacterized protein n=1 Tax=Penicillium nucicola TaxID=1850975 RepID=UPI002545B9FD|nr:uncharacterized protein N7511_008443 [Penicillium nucicola]KAJ5751478.1 hypothetical protein N7511_008443 [Penicillium nucicola]
MRTTDPATLALIDSAHGLTWSTKSEVSHVPASTLWHRANGRPSKEEKAANQQYLTTSEEDALVHDILRMSKNGYPPAVKFLPMLAGVLRRRRSPSDDFTAGCPVTQPSPSWRHDYNIRSKVEEWFSVIGSELHHAAIDPANVYNMDETGVMLSGPSSLKVLVGKECSGSRGARLKREVVTAIECISADGRALYPVIIWPATTHRSTWTTHPTPNWHFACSKSGYTDSAISLYWIKHVFDPQTRAQAGNKPRLLISDGFGTHESMEVRARNEAFTRRNILSGWSKSGLHPFNPEKVLGNIQKPPEDIAELQCDAGVNAPHPSSDEPPVTPVTFDGVCLLRKIIEEDLRNLDVRGKLCFQKMLNATEKAFAERSLLLQRNQELFQQNKEKKIRQGVKSTVVGKAKVMKYEDIVEAKRKREEKESSRVLKKRKTRRKTTEPRENIQAHAPRPMEEFCSVLQF